MFVWPWSMIKLLRLHECEIAGYKNNFKIVKQIKESPGFYSWLSGTVNEEIHGADDRIFHCSVIDYIFIVTKIFMEGYFMAPERSWWHTMTVAPHLGVGRPTYFSRLRWRRQLPVTLRPGRLVLPVHLWARGIARRLPSAPCVPSRCPWLMALTWLFGSAGI